MSAPNYYVPLKETTLWASVTMGLVLLAFELYGHENIQCILVLHLASFPTVYSSTGSFFLLHHITLLG